jgi:hypothetical protein
VVLTAPVDFTVTGKIAISDWLSTYKDESRVELVKIVGTGRSAKFVIRDETALRPDIKSWYDVEIQTASGGSLGKTKLQRDKFQKDGANPEITISLNWLTSDDQLDRYAKSGQTVILIAKVIREGEKLGHAEFVVKSTLQVP